MDAFLRHCWPAQQKRTRDSQLLLLAKNAAYSQTRPIDTTVLNQERDTHKKGAPLIMSETKLRKPCFSHLLELVVHFLQPAE